MKPWVLPTSLASGLGATTAADYLLDSDDSTPLGNMALGGSLGSLAMLHPKARSTVKGLTKEISEHPDYAPAKQKYREYGKLAKKGMGEADDRFHKALVDGILYEREDLKRKLNRIKNAQSRMTVNKTSDIDENVFANERRKKLADQYKRLYDIRSDDALLEERFLKTNVGDMEATARTNQKEGLKKALKEEMTNNLKPLVEKNRERNIIASQGLATGTGMTAGLLATLLNPFGSEN